MEREWTIRIKWLPLVFCVRYSLIQDTDNKKFPDFMLNEIKCINHLVQFICTISWYYNVLMIHEKIIRKEKMGKNKGNNKDPFSFTQK